MLFKDVYGQSKMKETFIKMVNDNRLAHAILLYGPQGAGKLAMALALAQYVNCPNRTDSDACGKCPSCVQMQKLVHPDLHFAFPISRDKDTVTCDNFLKPWREMVLQSPYFTLTQWEQSFSQNQKRSVIYANESDNIIRKLGSKSYESEYKVMIIWLPEKMMDDVCANKLLKIIEEPPEKTIFILVSEEHEQLLPTITSRTQRFFIPPLTEDDVTNALRPLHPDMPQDELENTAHIANGNLNRAIALCEETQTNDDNFEWFVRIMRMSYLRQVKEMRQWSEEVAQAGRKQQLAFLQYAQKTIRENFIHNMHEKRLNYQSKEEATFSQKFAPFINEKNISAFLSEFELAERHIAQNVQAKIVFFDIALKVAVLIRMK